ncbi:MAG: LPS-assembly protein LptD [Candidatus Cloacimonetes bacterium]|nr:LPS-assembly protein LptD [Candidatus Cloacimonadota bacterium]
MQKILILLILCFLCCHILLLAQNTDAGEIMLINVEPLDTLQTQEATLDSLYYMADRVAYDTGRERIDLFGKARVDYQQSQISADSMYIDLKKEQAFTYGATVMRDGEQILLGRDVAYDIRSQTGSLQSGISRLEKAFYTGAEVRKVGNKMYDIEDGTFTSCDLAEPDFWFSAHKLRIYQDDKIVGKPVIAWVNHFPVFYFPFITMSIKRGRHPGFLVPEPGYNNVDGKFIRDIAWYYPFHDYADLILGMDIMEHTGWKAKLSTIYTKRYEFDGNFHGAYQKRIMPGGVTYDWSLRALHHHELGEKATFDLNLDFISNKRIWESSGSLDENLAERLSSSMSYRQPLLGSYLNVGATYNQDLVNDRAYLSLPSASFSVPGQPLYELFLKPQRSPSAWWSNFNYSYQVRLDHTGEVSTKGSNWKDFVWNNTFNPADTTATTYLTRHHAGIRHTLGLSYNYRLFGWLNTQESISYNEAWFDRDRDDKKWVRGNDYSANASANFNIYGVRNFRRGLLSSIRHIITPSASIGFRPKLEENTRFYSFGGIGLASGDATTTLSLGVEQKWQLKYRKGGEEKRLGDVLSWSSRASTNLKSEEKKFTYLSHSLAFSPGTFDLGTKKLPGTNVYLRNISTGYNARFSMNHNPHDISWTSLALRNQYFSHGFSITGSSSYKNWFQKPKNQIFTPYEEPDSLGYHAESLSSMGTSDSWRLSLTQDVYADKDIFHPANSNLRLEANAKVSQNWYLSYATYYDIKNSQSISQSIALARDLHCWRLEVSYARRNEFWEYRLSLYNLALPDALRLQTRDSKRY